MVCALCGGRVEWQGKLSELTHTLCLSCGETNSQNIIEQEQEEIFENNNGDENDY